MVPSVRYVRLPNSLQRRLTYLKRRNAAIGAVAVLVMGSFALGRTAPPPAPAPVPAVMTTSTFTTSVDVPTTVLRTTTVQVPTTVVSTVTETSAVTETSTVVTTLTVAAAAAPEPEQIPQPAANLPPEPAPAAAYYANCTEVREAGAAPIYSGDPGYSSKLDRDGDGVACEN